MADGGEHPEGGSPHGSRPASFEEDGSLREGSFESDLLDASLADPANDPLTSETGEVGPPASASSSSSFPRSASHEIPMAVSGVEQPGVEQAGLKEGGESAHASRRASLTGEEEAPGRSAASSRRGSVAGELRATSATASLTPSGEAGAHFSEGGEKEKGGEGKGDKEGDTEKVMNTDVFGGISGAPPAATAGAGQGETSLAPPPPPSDEPAEISMPRSADFPHETDPANGSSSETSEGFGSGMPAVGSATPSLETTTPAVGPGTTAMESATPAVESGMPDVGSGTPSLGSALGTPTASVPTEKAVADEEALKQVFFFFTLVTGPRRSLSLKLSDTS